MKMTTIVVGPDGQVFNLGNKEYPPIQKDGKNYIPAFGQTVSEEILICLKRMTLKEVLHHYGIKQ